MVKNNNKKQTTEQIIQEVLFSYLTMPIWIIIHLIWFIGVQLTKPLYLLSEETRKDKNYFIKGKFNFCKYMWATLQGGKIKNGR